MITNTGKNILAKYLVGQAPSYASYIAIGCGAKPLASDGVLGDYSTKESLDFEMFRVPITSRGYVEESGVSKIVLTAELPTEERYEITEVGIFSAGSNISAGAYDSRSIYSFDSAEGWKYDTAEIKTVYSPLDGENNDNIITGTYDLTADTIDNPVILPVFQTNADNRIFTNAERLARYERCRFLNNIIMMSGDTSSLTKSGNHLVVGTGSNYVELTGTSLDLTKNSPTDQIKFAFSVINKDGASSTAPDEVRVLLEFASSGIHGEGTWARFEVILTDADYDFATNRYVVSTKQLQDLHTSSGFSWNAINTVRIYCSVINNSLPSSDFYVGLDAVRLENITTINTLYGLTGYSVIRNTAAETIVKTANTTNYIEFRFAMDVL